MITAAAFFKDILDKKIFTRPKWSTKINIMKAIQKTVFVERKRAVYDFHKEIKGKWKIISTTYGQSDSGVYGIFFTLEEIIK